jgi:hypothetical protein
MLLFTLHNKIIFIFIPVPKPGYLQLFVQTTLSDGWLLSNKTISLSKYTLNMHFAPLLPHDHVHEEFKKQG